jgi:hypothetical protein
VVQVPIVVVTAAQELPVHVPEQHCDGDVHAVPTVWHDAAAHVPEVQAREQHSLGEVQPWPELLQNVDDVHLPEAQIVEQQSASAVQVSPPTPHAGAGGAAHLRSAPHLPEQHAPGLPAVQVVPWARHWPWGSTQSPFAHEFVQQFESEPQGWPTTLHVDGATQLPVQAWLQHSEGVEQAVPFALHASAPQVPLPLHWFEQHSLAPVQSAPSLLHVGASPQKPFGHDPEQHSEPATHAAPFA